MLIPFILLWGVQIPKKRKFVFIGLISLTTVTMVISIARAADGFATHWNTQQDDASYICLWTAVEPCAAMIVACLTAFPQLFAPSLKPIYTHGEVAWVDHQHKNQHQYTGGGTGKRLSKNKPSPGARSGVGQINVLVSYGHQISRISQEPMEGSSDQNSDDMGYVQDKDGGHYHMSNVSKSQESQLPIMGWEPPVPVSPKLAAAAGLYTRTRTSVNGRALL